MFAIVFAALAVGTLSEKMSLSSGVAALAEHLESVGLDGQHQSSGLASGRKMIVDNMLRVVQKSEKLDDAKKDILRNVSNLLTQILNDLVDDRIADQGQLDTILMAIPACRDDDAVASESVLELAANGRRTDHTTCRGEESSLFDADALACGTMTDFMKNTADAHCHFPNGADDASEIQTWGDMLLNGELYFDALSKQWPAQRDACQAADSEWSQKAAECDTLFLNFETKVCEWSDARSARCNAEATCVNSHTTTHNARVTSVTNSSNQREADAAMIHYVRCLVDKMIEGADDYDTWKSSCEAQRTKDYSADYNVEFPTVPTLDPACSLVQEHPGTANWESSEYSDFNQDKVSIPDTDYECVL